MNLCHALRIRVQINKPHGPRAKGQVEKAQDIVERSFESGLKLFKVESFEQLNALAWQWMRHFNATSIHSRTGKTRYATWLQLHRISYGLRHRSKYCANGGIGSGRTHGNGLLNGGIPWK
jgi:hypothetical protein